MFHLDLKRAEVALASGRLEEACKLAKRPEVHEHRDGQRLVDALIEALLIRAAQHLEVERLEEARHDAQLAFELGGRKTDVATTLNRIEEFEMTRIRTALDAGDHELALASIAALSPARQAQPLIMQMSLQMINPIAQRGLEELAAGRLDRAAADDQLLAPLRHRSALAAELHDNVNRCRTVHEQLKSSRYAEAERMLALLAQTLPTANWLASAGEALAEANRKISTVLAGPIGLAAPATTFTPSAPRSTPRRESNPSPGGASRQLLLQVDGIGSIMLHRPDQLTIGSASSSARYDLPVQTAGMNVPIVLRRNGDDYFAESETAFCVNQKSVTRQLLSPGDQIAFGQRGRLRFIKPVAASSSAVLQITGAGLTRRDIRHIVLMGDSLVFAPSGGHFCLASSPQRIILYGQGDALAIRATHLPSRPDAIYHDHPLHSGDSQVVGGVRFALVPFHSR